MRNIGILAVAALMLAACGAGGGKAQLAASCKKEGTDAKVCDCMATEMEKNMDKKVFAAMVKGASGKEEDAQKMLQGMTMEQQMSAATATMGAAVKCGMGPS